MGTRFLFGNYDADPETGLIALAYAQDDGSAFGGVVLTNFTGTPIRVIPLPFVPERVVIRSVSPDSP